MAYWLFSKSFFILTWIYTATLHGPLSTWLNLRLAWATKRRVPLKAYLSLQKLMEVVCSIGEPLVT